MSYALAPVSEAAPPTIANVNCLIDRRKAEMKAATCVHLVGTDGVVLCNCSLIPKDMSLFLNLSITEKFAEYMCAESLEALILQRASAK